MNKINLPSLNLYPQQIATTDVADATSTATSTNNSSSVQKSLLPPESPINYTDNGNGTITDNYTGLMWKRCPEGFSGTSCQSGSLGIREWIQSDSACNNLNFAGKTDWRLPTLKELESIVDTRSFSVAVNKKFFTATDDPYWTETSPAGYTSSKFSVIFADGSAYYRDISNFAATRCVRSTK